MNIIRNKKPICFFGNQILLNFVNKLYFYDTFSLKLNRQLVLPYPWYKTFLGRIRVFRRMLRLGVMNGLYFNEKLFVTFDNKIYCIDPLTLNINAEYFFKKERKTLNLAVINNIEHFDNGLYFGEYFGNSTKEEVHIIKRDISGGYSIAYKFPKGTINHVHNIIPDPYNDCVWVLTGDFGDAASIWQAKNNFETMNPILSGSQQYRACVAYPSKNGLLYATDTQFENNHIRLLCFERNKWKTKKIFPLNGSVIYGCSFQDKYVFSTTTEPADSHKNMICKLFDTKRGPGILKNESHIVMGSLNKEFEIITKKKKDLLPYRLFQFGTIFFPQGNNPTDNLFSYSIGNIKNDMDTEIRPF